MIEVVAPGPSATVQDLGRSGWRHLGVGTAGAMDPAALALANRLVGNRPGAAGIEVTLGGLVVRFHTAVVIALTGAPCAAVVEPASPERTDPTPDPLGRERAGRAPDSQGGARTDPTPGPLGGERAGRARAGVAMGAPAVLLAGSTVRLGAPESGVRTYLAVRGGVDVEPVLGSRSYDTLSRIGPSPLAAGDRLPIGPDPGTPIDVDVAPQRPQGGAVRLWPGPRERWFAGAMDALLAGTWLVRTESDRVGVRLDGPPLRRAHDEELPSEGLVAGAVQVPHDGRPIVMMADHPVTGGYPVVAIVDPADLATLAQARPGDPIRFATANRTT